MTIDREAPIVRCCMCLKSGVSVYICSGCSLHTCNDCQHNVNKAECSHYHDGLHEDQNLNSKFVRRSRFSFDRLTNGTDHQTWLSYYDGEVTQEVRLEDNQAEVLGRLLRELISERADREASS